MTAKAPSSDTPLVELLRGVPYFGGAAAARLETMAQQASRRQFSPGEIIFLEGDPSAGLWIVEEGRVKIYKISPEGSEHIIHLVGPGDSFNDIAALDSRLNPANTAALSAVTTWVISSEALATILRDDPALASDVILFLTGRIRMLVRQIEDLALHSVTTRLARFLIDQAENPALSGPGVTRAAIAAHLATTPETVSRALRALEEAGAIRFDRHRIVVVREDVLRALALV